MGRDVVTTFRRPGSVPEPQPIVPNRSSKVEHRRWLMVAMYTQANLFANRLQLAITENPIPFGMGLQKLLHQQHLTGALDRAIQAALIMRRQAGVLARQNAALVGRELPQQSRVLEIERLD